MQKKWIRYATRILLGLILLWLVICLSALIYFNSYKQQLLAKANSFLNERFYGTVHIKDVSINFLTDFPNPSIQVNQVTMDDSVYYSKNQQHTLQIDHIIVIPKLLSLVTGHLTIKQIVLQKGLFYILHDSSGYSNAYVFNPKVREKIVKDSTTNTVHTPIEFIGRQFHVIIADSLKHKLYDFDINRISIHKQLLLSGDDGWETSLDLTVRSMQFNTTKGSYLRNQPVKVDFIVKYNPAEKHLYLKQAPFVINKVPLTIDADFRFDSTHNFNLHILAPELPFATAVSWMPHNISSKLDTFKLQEPVILDAHIEGSTAAGGDPHIQLKMNVDDNMLETPKGILHHCSFTGRFDNEIKLGIPRGDPNSRITIDSLHARWEDKIALQCHQIIINDLQKPGGQFDLTVNNDLVEMNDLLESDRINITQGSADIQLHYEGPFADSNTLTPIMNGHIKLKDAAVVYTPRNLELRNGQVILIFQNQDMIIQNLSGLLAGSPIQIHGGVKNLQTLLRKAPELLVLDWEIHSPHLDMGTLLSFLGKGQETTSAEKRKETRYKLRKTMHQIDAFIDQCKVNTRLRIDQLVYEQFTAQNVNASLALNRVNWQISHLSMQVADGLAIATGSVDYKGNNSNEVQLYAQLNHLNVSKLMYGFNDFGQRSLKHNNISGILNATANLSLRLNDGGKKQPGSLNGSLDFTLDNGELNNFAPLQKMSSLLKNRDFSHVRFAKLYDNFHFDKDTLIFNRMEVQSNVLTMYIQGLYKMDGDYTNMQIQIPFSNLKKRDDDIPESKGLKARLGLSLFVKAYNEKNEPVKLTISPFKGKIGRRFQQ